MIRYVLLILTLNSFNASDQDWADQEKAAIKDEISAPGADESAAEATKQLANPVAALISVPLQNNIGLGPNKNGIHYTLNVQPVIPIAPPPLSSPWLVIRRNQDRYFEIICPTAN